MRVAADVSRWKFFMQGLHLNKFVPADKQGAIHQGRFIESPWHTSGGTSFHGLPRGATTTFAA
jgi:hypothetical protein